MYKEMAILGHKEKVREDEIEVYKLKEIYWQFFLGMSKW